MFGDSACCFTSDNLYKQKAVATETKHNKAGLEKPTAAAVRKLIISPELADSIRQLDLKQGNGLPSKVLLRSPAEIVSDEHIPHRNLVRAYWWNGRVCRMGRGVG